MSNVIQLPQQAINLGAFRYPTSIKLAKIEPITKHLGSIFSTSTGTTGILYYYGLGSRIEIKCDKHTLSGYSSYTYGYKEYTKVIKGEKKLLFSVVFYTPMDDYGRAYDFTLWTMRVGNISTYSRTQEYSDDKQVTCPFTCEGDCPWHVVDKVHTLHDLKQIYITDAEYTAAYSAAKAEFVEKYGLDLRYFRYRL